MAVVDIRSSGAFVLLLLVLLPGVAAYSVEEARLHWYEHEVRTIAPNVDLPGVVATLRLSADFQRCWDERPLPVCALILETDGLAALDNQRLEIRDRCRAENGSILCTTPAATLRVTNGTARIGYYGQAGTERGIRGEIALPLTLDTTVPSVASITTGLCIGDNGSTCYIAANVPSPVTVTFTDTQTAFDWRLVFLGRDGATGTRARECSGTVCTFDLITPCTDGQEFRLGLTSAGAVSSREDAQNTVAPFSGTRVVCKTDGPKIVSFNITANGIAGQAVSGGTLSATARVTGGVGDVTVSVATGGILGENLTNQTVTGACDAPDADGARTCAWELGPLADGTFTLSFIATDALGLYSKREQKVTVLRLVTLPNGTTLDLFTIVPGKLNPEALNRLALDVASANNLPYPSYLPYTVLRKKDGARIWRQELTACEYRTPSDKNWTASHNLLALGASSGTRGESHVMRPDADWNVSNRLDLQVRADRVTMALADEFATRCTIALVVQDGNTLYETPEFENITFKIVLRESPLGEPGAEFVKKITETQEKLEGSQARTIRKLEKWRQQADKYCGYVEQYVTIHNSMAVLMGVGDGMCGVFGTGQAIKGVGGGIFAGLDGILEPMWNGMLPEGGVIAQNLNRAKQATDIAAVFGVIPDNNLLLQGGGPLRMFCMQVNCRITATLNTAYLDKKDKDAGTTREFKTKSAQRQAELEAKYPDLPKNNPAGAPNQPGSSGMFKDYSTRDAKGQPIETSRTQKLGNYAKEEILENANVADPMRSMTGAVMTMCMGGVIYNLQKYQAIDCGYLQCLKDQSYYGHSINVCDQGRSYKLCTQVVGEAMELPFVNTVKNIMSNINHAIATAPNFLAKFFLNEYCNSANQRGTDPVGVQAQTQCGNLQSTFCAVAGSAINAVDAAKQTQQAFGGLRDDSAAKRQLEICDQALRNQTAPSAPTSRQQAESSYTNIEAAAWERSVRASSAQTPENNFLGDVDRMWLEANGVSGNDPAYYKVNPNAVPNQKGESVRTIEAYDSNGGKIESTTPVQLVTVKQYDKEFTYVSTEVDRTSYLAGASKGLGTLTRGIGKLATGSILQGRDPTLQAPTTTQATDAATDGAKASDTKKKVEVRIQVQGGENTVGVMARDTIMLEARTMAIRNGVQPVDDRAALNYYLYKTYNDAKLNEWPNLPELEGIVNSNQADLETITAAADAARASKSAAQSGDGTSTGGTTQGGSGGGDTIDDTGMFSRDFYVDAAKTHETKANELKAQLISATDRTPQQTAELNAKIDAEIKEMEYWMERAKSATYSRPKSDAEAAAKKAAEDAKKATSACMSCHDSKTTDQKITAVKQKKSDAEKRIDNAQKEYDDADFYATALESANVESIRVERNDPVYGSLYFRTQDGSVISQRDDPVEFEAAKWFLDKGFFDNTDIEGKNSPEEARILAGVKTGKLKREAQTELSAIERELNALSTQQSAGTISAISATAATPEVRAAADADNNKQAVGPAIDTATVTGDRAELDAQLEAIARQYDKKDPEKATNIRILKTLPVEEVKEYFRQEQEYAQQRLDEEQRKQAAAIAQIRSDPAAAAKFYVTMSEELEVIAYDLEQPLADTDALKAKRAAVLNKLCAASTTCDPTTMTGIGATGDLLTVEEMEQKLTEEAKQKATQASADIASGKYDKDFAAYTKRRESYMAAVSVISDYAVKWARDKGYLNWLSLSSWADDVPALQELLDFSNTYLNPDAFAENLCSETYDIRDNDDGAVYQVSQVGIARALATFGSEIRTYENEGRTEFLYVTVAHVVNPGPGNISFEMVMRDITSCASSTCEETHSLMNGAALTLGEGESFSNGQYARTRIEYLPGEYGKVCLRFNKEFPDAQGKREYCRSIKEDSISTGSPVAPQPTATTAPSAAGTGGASAAGNNPLEGWS